MPFLKLFFVAFGLFLLHNETKAGTKNDWVSPCPDLFVYERTNEPDRWYGNITLLSKLTLHGVWVELTFDRPVLDFVVSTWFGEVKPYCKNGYLVRNLDRLLTANSPETIRFYVKYNTNEPPPKLLAFYLNGGFTCPPLGVGIEADTISPIVSLLNNSHDGGDGNRPGSTKPDSDVEEDDFFINEFSSLLRLKQRPTSNNEDLNDICGTVIIPQPRPLKTQYQAREGEFPWHSALYHSNGIDLTYICGASLISNYHVITVAHCVTKRKSQDALNPNNLNVYLGKFYWKRFTSPGFQVRDVSKIITHSQYNAKNYSNDIALVKFTQPADITDYVRPVCLWQESHDLSLELYQQGNVVGWGFDARGEVSETVIKAQMAVDSQGICLSSNSKLNSLLNSGTYCASYVNGTSVCTSDYGGGMVFAGPGSKRNSLRGLVTVIITPENKFKCDVSNYVVFTDVAKYHEWIKESMLL